MPEYRQVKRCVLPPQTGRTDLSMSGRPVESQDALPAMATRLSSGRGHTT
jgi:hypothetical protein